MTAPTAKPEAAMFPPSARDPDDDAVRSRFEGLRVSGRIAIFQPGSANRVVLSLQATDNATVQTSVCMPIGDLRSLRDAIDAAIAQAGG